MNEDNKTDHSPSESPENLFALSLPKSDESFPVLKAFQEFLEAERERARRRQMTLTIAFMVAIVVIVVLFCVIGTLLFGDLVKRSDAKQDKLLEFLLADRKPAVAVVASPSQEIDPVIAELVEAVRQLKATTEAQKSAPVAEALPPIIEPDPILTPPAQVKVNTLPPAVPVAESEPSHERPAAAPSPTIKAAAQAPQRVDVSPAPVAEVKPIEAEPAAKEVAPTPEPPKKMSDSPIQVKVVPTRAMRVPEGLEAGEISIVTTDNVRYPWRILMPTGDEAKAQ